ncbi:MAG TPA: polysaccharide biosynthesis protein [Chloroflexota bacterium]
MSRTSPPPAELLLGRPERLGDLARAAELVRERRVLVTGAAGSLGWPLSHALLRAEPRRLVLVDHHEHSLFGLERALGPSDRTRFELADIRDSARMGRVFDEYRPELVIHLAAAKHVPYGERFPEGAVATNVLATRTLLELADRAGTRTVVYPSSDKSVLPPSVYGATKRLAEALVQAMSGQRQWAVVRYVNIIGTRGSVIETFTQQILAERPLSVTDERMTRYWISMDEALWCALMTCQTAAPGEIVMPDCGESVPIVETARRLAGWYRPEQVPYPLTCTGIRPGERLDEVLLSPNESFAVADAAPGVRLVRTRRDAATLSGIHATLDRLEELVRSGEREALARTCLEAAAELQ